jgi:NAD(P)-dependent dehydrogenase (short-subunit alcohol dehydrogenase family)
MAAGPSSAELTTRARKALPRSSFALLPTACSGLGTMPTVRTGSPEPNYWFGPLNWGEQMAVALITGANSGIGLATAVTFGRAGHTVIAAMRNREKGMELEKIVAAEKLPVSPIAMDVDDSVSVESAMGEVMSKHERIDVLVNNAGIAGGGAVEDASLVLFHQITETNFFGALRCIKAVLPGMRTRRSGCIVNVTSVAGRVATAAAGAYSASKWALEALSESLAQEVSAFNVRVAIVEPGWIATAMTTTPRPPLPESAYPHSRRFRAYANAFRSQYDSPYVVGECIRQIFDGDSWRLRYPVGSTAAPILERRLRMSDEEWVREGASSDAEWIANFKQSFGLEVSL